MGDVFAFRSDAATNLTVIEQLVDGVDNGRGGTKRNFEVDLVEVFGFSGEISPHFVEFVGIGTLKTVN